MIEIDWSKAPEWVIAHALYAFIDEIHEAWIGVEQYQRLDHPKPFPYGDSGVLGAQHNPRRSWFKYVTPRPAPWDGEGLPPVGTVCEFAGFNPEETMPTDPRVGDKVTVIAHFMSGSFELAAFTFYAPPEFEYLQVAQGAYGCFRSIRTPEQIEAEERAKAIDAMIAACPYPGSDCTRIDCEALYDANYRKQVQP